MGMGNTYRCAFSRGMITAAEAVYQRRSDGPVLCTAGRVPPTCPQRDRAPNTLAASTICRVEKRRRGL